MKTTPVHQRLETRHQLKPTPSCLSETSEGRQWAEAACDWYVVSNQQSFIDQAIDQWQDCFNACLKVKSKHWTFAIMFLRNCHDFSSIRYCWYEQIDLRFVSQGKVRTSVKIGGQFCCSFTANLLQYLFAKNYGNIRWLDKVIAKIKGCNFFATLAFLGYRSINGSKPILLP